MAYSILLLKKFVNKLKVVNKILCIVRVRVIRENYELGFRGSVVREKYKDINILTLASLNFKKYIIVVTNM